MKNVQISKLIKIAVFLIVLCLIGIGLVFLWQFKVKEIISFKECVQAGYPILESYPLQCRTPDGRIFYEEVNIKSRISPAPSTVCVDYCGDGVCQEVVCLAIGCPCAETPESCPDDCRTQVANPASVFCVDHGGKLEIRTDESGGQTGYCIFSDNSECEEWSFFRGDCRPGAVLKQGILRGHVTIGPFCPVERIGSPCPVPSGVYASRQIIVYASDGVTVIAGAFLDEDGNYRFELKPGDYIVDAGKSGIGFGGSVIRQVEVRNGTTTTADFDIDTGIR